MRYLRLYYFRDKQGLEVDFVMPGRGSSLSLWECKAGKTVTPAMAAPMLRLAVAMKRKRPKETRVNLFLVHRAPKAGSPVHAVAPGVRALPWHDFVEDGAGSRPRTMVVKFPRSFWGI